MYIGMEEVSVCLFLSEAACSLRSFGVPAKVING